MRLVSGITLGLLLLLAPPARAAGDPFVGTYKDERLTITLAPAAQGYRGEIVMGNKTFPATAEKHGEGITGKFTSGGDSFVFWATLEQQTLVLRTGASTYRLTQAVNPLDQPANPLDQPAPPNPLDRPPANPPANPPPPALPDRSKLASPEQVEKAISKAKAWLYTQQHQGNWEMLPAQAPNPVPDAEGHVRVVDVMNSSQWGGLSALALYALMASGDNIQDPRIAKGIEFVKACDMKGTYSISMRAQVWNLLPKARRKEFMDAAKRDRDLLMGMRKTDPDYKGLYRYTAQEPGYDHSCSQFAILGMWALSQFGLEVPNDYWRDAEDSWIKNQDRASGGWNYGLLFKEKPPVTASMTAAGVATLFITQEFLRADAGLDCKGNIPHPSIDAGLKWMSDNFAEVSKSEWPIYTLYGVERIGVASGYKYFGAVDWYQQGAAALLGAQGADGAWRGNVYDTAFGILFLVRGRAPVAISKLQYEFDTHGDRGREPNWNQRPRDAANLVHWLAAETERDLNWQIVTLKGDPRDLHDSPILYIAGNQVLNFSEADEKKLKAFVEEGGLIVANADCGQQGFANSYKKLGARLFPPHEFKEVPPGHLIYNNLYSRSKWKSPPSVLALSNDARLLMILIPTADPARFWQGQVFNGKEELFQLMENIFLYAVDKRNLRVKGDNYIVSPDPQIRATRTAKVARLDYGGNWDPEPGGWRRQAAVEHNDRQIDLDVQPVKLGDDKLGGFKFAHLTGTGRFKLTDK